jgi:hypothetical protein
MPACFSASEFTFGSPPKGLFHRAICISGGSFTPLQSSKQTGIGLGIPVLNLAESTGKEFFKELGVADIKAARALSAEDIQLSKRI